MPAADHRMMLHHLRLAFRREDEAPDEDFYAEPRLVTHIDEQAIAAVRQLYREYLPADGTVLDLMSSWVSHLPAEVAYSRVVGLGMNRTELAANPRLDGFVVHDLNRDPRLPFADAEFDAAAICVSIQYLTRPVAVLRDLGRVLVAGGPLVISFSNRCFPTKAVRGLAAARRPRPRRAGRPLPEGGAHLDRHPTPRPQPAGNRPPARGGRPPCPVIRRAATALGQAQGTQARDTQP